MSMVFFVLKGIENMKSKYIYNAFSDIYAGTILRMADLAFNAGYEFFVFNGIVYHLTKERKIAETSLTQDDIFYGL